MNLIIVYLSIFFFSSCSIFSSASRETSTLYRWEVSEKVFIWKYIGNEEINPMYKGEIKDNKPDGMGTTIFPDGYRHSGQYKLGKRHGSGTWFTKKSGKVKKYSKGEWKQGYFWNMITYDFDGEVRDEYKNGLLTYGVLFTYKENENRIWTRYDENRDGVYVGGIKNRKPEGIGLVKFDDGNKLYGKWNGGFFNDNGTFVYPNGSIYTGKYKNGKWDGKGILTFPNGETTEGIFKDGTIWDGIGSKKWLDGRTYVGNFKYGKMHGQGTFSSSKGSKYVGGYKFGKKDGQGTFTWLDGSSYLGGYKNGMFHGQGTFSSSDGSKYIGGYKFGKKDGQGTFTWFDGSSYLGEYKNGKFHGQGTFSSSEGSKYVGEYKFGKKDGQGTLTHSEGIIYVGMFKDGVRHGKGIEKYQDMNVIKGVWKKDIFWNGFGRERVSDGKKIRDFYDGGKITKKELTLTNGDKYFGELKNDKFDGQGTFTWSDGGQYIGEFKNGKYNGQGEYTYGNGEWEGQKYLGTFKNGKYNGQGTYTWSDGRKFVGEFILGRFWNGIEYDISGKNNIKIIDGKIKIIKN